MFAQALYIAVIKFTIFLSYATHIFECLIPLTANHSKHESKYKKESKNINQKKNETNCLSLRLHVRNNLFNLTFKVYTKKEKLLFFFLFSKKNLSENIFKASRVWNLPRYWKMQTTHKATYGQLLNHFHNSFEVGQISQDLFMGWGTP